MLEWLARSGQGGELAQDLAATLRLLTQNACIVRVRRSTGQGKLEFLRDKRDGSEGSAEFMGGRCGETVELGEMLLTCQHQLGGDQRVGELARLLGNLPRVDRDVTDREQDREPDAQHVDRRQLQRIVARPRQRVMPEHQQGRARHRERGEDHRHPRRQRGRGDQHRSEKQEREWVFQPAGQVEQERQLGQCDVQQPAAVRARAARCHENARAGTN